MILVLSNLADEAAAGFVRRFPAGAACLVTASDFHQSVRAAVSVSDFSASEITLGGTPLTAGQIRGVVATIPWFLPQEFYYIEPADRDYVCAEMSAFLIYFLSGLACKKLNPPSPRRLTGLGLHRLEWLRVAARCGVPVWPVRTKNGVPLPPGDSQELQPVRSTIVGGDVVGAGGPDRTKSTTICGRSPGPSPCPICPATLSPAMAATFFSSSWNPFRTFPARKTVKPWSGI